MIRNLGMIIMILSSCLLIGCEKQSYPLIENENNYSLEMQYLKEEYDISFGKSIPKVILDTDMTFLGDDAMCMCILAQADSIGLIDLLGITTTGGNTFVSVGTNATLRQLELIGRMDIPVYIGTDKPINGYRDLTEQEKIVGSIDNWGAMYNLDRYVSPNDYHNLGDFYETIWGYSEVEAQQQSSFEFMIEQVHLYEGEVTIISIGAPTNIALACQNDSSFAVNTSGIIYMGGVLSGRGTYTPYSDFNCFYDAKAFDICFNSDFPTQTMIPHDVVNQVVLNKSVFDLLNAKSDTLISTLWIDNEYSWYCRTTSRKDNCADAITAVVFLLPEVITTLQELYVEINYDENDAEYGHLTVVDEDSSSSTTSKITFITGLDTDMYWDFTTDLLCQEQKESGYSYNKFIEKNSQ